MVFLAQTARSGSTPWWLREEPLPLLRRARTAASSGSCSRSTVAAMCSSPCIDGATALTRVADGAAWREGLLDGRLMGLRSKRFPAGSMFACNDAALQCLQGLNLAAVNFEPERGQTMEPWPMRWSACWGCWYLANQVGVLCVRFDWVAGSHPQACANLVRMAQAPLDPG